MNRRFEMHQYRHILTRMRLGESDRQIDPAGLMGRKTAAKLRKKATAGGWLDPDKPLPGESELYAAFARPRAAEARATPSAAPTGLSAATGNRKVDLDRAANGEGDLAGYRVLRSEQAGGPYTPVAEVGASATSYTDSGLDNGTTYYYVLTATDAAGNESPSSGEVGATPQKGGGRGPNK